MVGWGRVGALPPDAHLVDSGLAARGQTGGVGIKKPSDQAEEDKAYEGAGGGDAKNVPYTVHQNLPAEMYRKKRPGLYDGRFRYENSCGSTSQHGRARFLKPTNAVTFDFENMQIFLTVEPHGNEQDGAAVEVW